MKSSSNRRPIKKINNTMSHKLAALFIIVLLAFVCLGIRISLINATSGDRYRKQVMSQAQSRYESRVMPAKRGDILDRNGNVLAKSNKVYNVILDCKVVNENEDYIEPTIQALVELLGFEEKTIRTRLTSEATKDSPYQVLRRQLPMEDKKAWDAYINAAYVNRSLEESSQEEGQESPTKTPGQETASISKEEAQRRQNIQGVWFEEDYLRLYPYDSLACDAIGFTLSRDEGVSGLEGYYNTLLSGVDGRQYGYFNNSTDVEQTIIAPSNGAILETSLDMNIQGIVQKYVDAFRDVTGAAHVGVIVQDPNNGEILAMDGGDRYDLNKPRDLSLEYSEDQIRAMNDSETVEALNSLWSNYTVSDAFEPGSVVKPIVMATALQKGCILTSDVFECDGYQVFGAAGDVMIRCAIYPGYHGTQTLGNIIANSCNDCMMQIGALIGVEQFIEGQTLFNFGSRTGIDLPGEGYGMIHTKQSMGETELACSSFGQGFTCTMIQECNAICSAINGGNYYQPHLVTAIRDSKGGLVKNITPMLLKATVSPTISSDIRSYMAECISDGTGIYAGISGYSMGGKTGTAEKIPRGNGNYLVSFIGFAPVQNPKVVVYVVVDEPNVDDQASSIFPQYIAQGIFSELLPYLRVSKDESESGNTRLWEGFNGRVPSTYTGELDSSGYLLNNNGYRVDWDGNLIDASGYLIDEDGNYLLDDDGNYIQSTNMDGIDGSKVTEGVSNINSPQPPADTSSPLSNNNMESEGITNEEAGLD